jgi:hypothetical protein
MIQNDSHMQYSRNIAPYLMPPGLSGPESHVVARKHTFYPVLFTDFVGVPAGDEQSSAGIFFFFKRKNLFRLPNALVRAQAFILIVQFSNVITHHPACTKFYINCVRIFKHRVQILKICVQELKACAQIFIPYIYMLAQWPVLRPSGALTGQYIPSVTTPRVPWAPPVVDGKLNPLNINL